MREFEIYHTLFKVTPQKLYYISNSGKIGFIEAIELRKRKGVMDESLIHWIEPKTLVRGQKRLSYVIVEGTKRMVKKLVAYAFIPDYSDEDTIIEHKDGNYENCDVRNLLILNRHKILSLKAKKRKTTEIVVRKKGEEVWKTYNSIKEAAEALFVFNDTLANYLNRKTRNSILMDYEFIVNRELFEPRKRTGANWKIKSGIK